MLLIFELILINVLVQEALTYKFYEREPEYQRSRFKSFKCKSENSTILTFFYCRVKVTRNSSALVVNATVHHSLGKQIYPRASISYKYGTIYREVIKIPPVETCAALKNLQMMPPFIKAFLESFGESMAAFMRGCPFNGDYVVQADLDLSKFPSILPSGMYKVEIWVEDGKSLQIAYFALEMEIVSNIKTSFK